MTRWRDRRTGRLRRLLSGRRDYLDGLRDGALCGWALPRAGAGPVPVALCLGAVRIAETVASQFRADLRDAGLGGGACGFAFPLTEERRARIRAGGGVVRVLRLDGRREAEIGRIRLDPAQGRPPARPSGPAPAALREVLAAGCAALRDAPGPHAAPPPAPRPLTPRQLALFAETDPETGASLPAPLCAYMAFTRPRYRLEVEFDWATAPEEAAHFLNWYLAGYAPLRAPRRVPLSRRAIDWLNAPQVIGGQRQSLSRATWAFLMGVPHLRQAMDFANPDWVDWVIYWWSVHQARALGAEDCLVPETYVTRLAGVPPAGGDGPLPLSRYLLRLAAETPALGGIDPGRATGRQQMLCAALVMAAERPDTLRYLPAGSVDALLTPGPDGQSPLGAFLCTLDGQARPLSRAEYAACLAARGHDIETGRFTTISAEGHRLEAARFPAPAPGGRAPVVDVQVIGPVTKASGLGEATRASLAALGAAGFTTQAVRFDLDNPAPEVDVPCLAPQDAAPARVSLLHLNAESVPLFFAYAPDITTDTHTIAYMFWELSRPAAAHALALRQIDEIWVASDHGRAIYADGFDGPVRVMGLATEMPPRPDRAAARRALCARTGFADAEFLCMATFDSFSFVQRKNPLGLIRAFAEAFPEGGARLLLKTQNRRRVCDPAQQAVWAEIDALTRGDRRFRVLDETLDRAALLDLVAGADAYLSLHRAEGWGFGMIEAMALGVPVLATGYSGNLAYCDDTTAWLVPATLTEPAREDYIFTPPGGGWGAPDHAAAVALLRQMRADPEARATRAGRARARVEAAFSPRAVGARYGARLAEIAGARDGRGTGRAA